VCPCLLQSGVLLMPRSKWADLEVESNEQLNDPSSDDISGEWSSESNKPKSAADGLPLVRPKKKSPRERQDAQERHDVQADEEKKKLDKDQRRQQRIWANAEVETKEELNDPSSAEDSAVGWSSGMCTPTDSQDGAQKPTGRDGSRKTKLRSKPLTNKPLTKEQLVSGDMSPSSAIDRASMLTPSKTGRSSSCGARGESPSSGGSSFRSAIASSESGDQALAHVPDSDRSSAGYVPPSSVEGAAPPLLEGMPSVGSALHESGKCKPCLFLKGKLGCDKGAECRFCHLHHKRSANPRPCKGKREWYKKLIARSDDYSSDVSGRSGGDGTSNSSPATPSGAPSQDVDDVTADEIKKIEEAQIPQSCEDACSKSNLTKEDGTPLS